MNRFRFVATHGIGCLLIFSPACTNQRQLASLDGCDVVDVAVSGGTDASFNWTPGCEIAALEVARRASGAIVWVTFSPGRTNSLDAPIQYGVFPPGAALTANLLEPLVAGTMYQVSVLRVDRGGGTLRAVGGTTFVP